MIVIITDTNIKNNIAFFISYIHSFNNLLKKILYYAINITLTEVKLFIIRCRINQAIQMQNILHIIVITDAIHTIKKIFNPSIYLH